MSNNQQHAPHRILAQPDTQASSQSLRRMLTRLQRTFLDLLFPPRCVHCGQSGQPGGRLCLTCRGLVTRLGPPWCQRCGQPGVQGAACPSCKNQSTALTGIRSALLFAGPVRPAIHALKYKHARDLAAPLAELMLPSWRHLPQPVDVLAPVPLHPARERERGYNQSQLLADVIGPALGIAVDGRLLERTRQTAPQVTLNAQARRQNVAEAFTVGRERAPHVLGRHVVLVDDVCTTGSTLGACAEALAAAGAQQVWAFTLARARWAPTTPAPAYLDDQPQP
ncbi:ComF family protein [Candidatus Amarolinea aalborgensis]|uniref:ComF family protein n=1 Tax=Candidatus Amarolinea aalborgensis TaxID=2249329 RepID=UPI003BF9C15A